MRPALPSIVVTNRKTRSKKTGPSFGLLMIPSTVAAVAGIIVSSVALLFSFSADESSGPLDDRIETLVSTLDQASTLLDDIEETLVARQQRVNELQEELDRAEQLQSLTEEQTGAIADLIGGRAGRAL